MTDSVEVDQKITAYAEAFLRSYAAVAANYGAVVRELESLGQRR